MVAEPPLPLPFWPPPLSSVVSVVSPDVVAVVVAGAVVAVVVAGGRVVAVVVAGGRVVPVVVAGPDVVTVVVFEPDFAVVAVVAWVPVLDPLRGAVVAVLAPDPLPLPEFVPLPVPEPPLRPLLVLSPSSSVDVSLLSSPAAVVSTLAAVLALLEAVVAFDDAVPAVDVDPAVLDDVASLFDAWFHNRSPPSLVDVDRPPRAGKSEVRTAKAPVAHTRLVVTHTSEVTDTPTMRRRARLVRGRLPITPEAVMGAAVARLA